MFDVFDKKRTVVLVYLPCLHRLTSLDEFTFLEKMRQFAYELRDDGVLLVPFPARPSWLYWPIFPSDMDEYKKWLARLGLGTDQRVLEYSWRTLIQGWPVNTERELRYYREFCREALGILGDLIHERQVSGIVFLTSSWQPDDDMQPLLEKISILFPSRALLHLQIGRPERDERAFLPGVRSLRFPEDRYEIRAELRSLEYVRGHASSLSPKRYLESRCLAPADAPEQDELDNVHLGAATPRALMGGETFVARFAAYTLGNLENVQRVIETEAPFAKTRLGLSTCLWRRGTRVNVRLSSPHIEVLNPNQEFRWNGGWHILRFDARIAFGVQSETIVLHFDVAAEGLPLVSLCPKIKVCSSHPGPNVSQQFLKRAAPRSAFASYAKGDRRDVLGRVRSLQIFTGIDVFLDCLSIRPGEQWKPKLETEICAREIFWLFWSREAGKSEWVEWEWRTALRKKSIQAIQPHPLEPAETAPPPLELSSLQFGTMYEWYVEHLREPRLRNGLRLLWRAIGRILSGSRK